MGEERKGVHTLYWGVGLKGFAVDILSCTRKKWDSSRRGPDSFFAVQTRYHGVAIRWDLLKYAAGTVPFFLRLPARSQIPIWERNIVRSSTSQIRNTVRLLLGR